MNLLCKAALPIAAAAGITTYLVAPGKFTAAQKAMFQDRNYAHRGLHTRDKSVPENSLPAFQAAVDAGYGIELDVHITADDKLVVFHDDTLNRVCGVPGNIEDKTLAELRRCRLEGTEYTIPTLDEALEVLSGKVPLILEVKRGKRNRELCALIYERLRRYDGPVCVESFDPFIVGWFRKNAPEILRGQLSQPPRTYKGDASAITGFLCGNLLMNVVARPQFISYKIAIKPLTVRLCETMGAIKAGWTSREWVHENDFDMLIFEHYKPGARFEKK